MHTNKISSQRKGAEDSANFLPGLARGRENTVGTSREREHSGNKHGCYGLCRSTADTAGVEHIAQAIDIALYSQAVLGVSQQCTQQTASI